MKKIAIFIVLLVCTVTAFSADKTVAIVASYEQNHVCGGPQEEGIVKGLVKNGWFENMNVKIHRYYMDTKRKNTTKESMTQIASAILDDLHKIKPDVIVTIDDNAFREVGLKFVGSPDTAVVFSGLNGQPENYNKLVHYLNSREKPGYNITGVYEKLYVYRSLMVMMSAVKGMKGGKVIGITDYTPTGNAITLQLEKELAGKKLGVEWELKRVRNWDEYVELINEINHDDSVKAIYPVALSLKVDEYKTYTAPEIFAWTSTHNKKPEMALNYFFSKIGLFGGAAVDFKSMGFAAGRQAGQILSGTDPGSLAVVDAPDYAIVFNLKRANDLGIDIPTPLLTAADFIFK